MDRCKCVVHTSLGEVRRCGQYQTADSEYCYHHNKMMTMYGKGVQHDYTPAPQDTYEPGVDKEYIIAYQNIETGEIRRIHQVPLD